MEQLGLGCRFENASQPLRIDGAKPVRSSGVAGSLSVAYLASGGTRRAPARHADPARPPVPRPTAGGGSTWDWNRWWSEGARGLLAADGSPRVLVVEPETQVLEGLRASLAREGFHVLGARSASEAVKCLVRGEHPDLALIDLALPDMHPRNLLVALRARCKHHLPAAFLSRTPAAPPRLGDSPVLRPPFEATRLLALIDAVVIGQQNPTRRQPDRVSLRQPHRVGGTIRAIVPVVGQAGNRRRVDR